jgi:anti-sigma factor RsiW
MRHPSEGALRAKIDGELDASELLEIDQHLAACGECREQLRKIDCEAQQVGETISALQSSAVSLGEAEQAWRRLQMRQESEEAPQRVGNVLSTLFLRHPAPAWSAAAITAVVVILVSFAPARSVAQRILAMLRVQKIAVVPIDLPLNPAPNTLTTIRRLISDRVVVTLSPGKPQMATTAMQASQLAGFPVRVLHGRSDAPQFAVTGEKAFVMTLDRERLQQIVDDLGHSDLQIPDSVDGKTIAVHIPKGVFERYGNCSAHRPGENPTPRPPSFSGAGSTNCLIFVQVPSPIVSVPPDLNVSQLAELGLEAAGMSPQEAEAFCQTVDWTSTLVIPIPEQASNYEKEVVDGAEGTLISHTSPDGRSTRYTLIWVKKGVIYSIIGFGNPGNAVALANSLD